MSILKKKETGNIEHLAPVFKWAGALSGVQKLLIVLATVLLIGVAYYFFNFKPKYENINKLKKTLQTKKKKLVTFKRKAKALPELEKKLNKLKEELNYAVAALPENKEIDLLITGISRAAKNTGSEVLNFKPEPEQIKDNFYAEIPIKIEISGHFHQLAHFFDELSRLYRIVNIEKTTIENDPKLGNKLKASCESVTYMFVDQVVDDKNKKGKKGKKKKKKGKK